MNGDRKHMIDSESRFTSISSICGIYFTFAFAFSIYINNFFVFSPFTFYCKIFTRIHTYVCINVYIIYGNFNAVTFNIFVIIFLIVARFFCLLRLLRLLASFCNRNKSNKYHNPNNKLLRRQRSMQTRRLIQEYY